MASWKIITRISIAGLNVAMVLAALALIGVGFWMRYDDSFDTDLKNVINKDPNDQKTLADAKFNIRVWIIVVFWSIVGLAFGAVLTGIFGTLQLFIKRRGFLIFYLILIIVLVVLELGSAVAMIIRRGQLRDDVGTMVTAMYSTNNVADIKVIQDKYHCCGTQNEILNDLYCPLEQLPTCDTAVFNSVDNTMMISGIILLIIIIFQILATILPVPILIKTSGSSKHSFTSTQIDRF